MAKMNFAVEVTDDRVSSRFDVQIAAGLRTPVGKRAPILIRNVSTDGFMAEGGVTLVPGSPITLELFDGTRFDARVIWKRDGHLGGAFVTPLTDEALAAIS